MHSRFLPLLRPGLVALGLLLPALYTRALPQQLLQSVQGVVRDSAGAPLAGADVVIGPRSTTTSQQGSFRIDSLRPGQYALTIRLVGFYPVRSRIAVVANEPTQLEYVLIRAPLTLPTMVVTSHRTGLYGSVGDTAYHAAVGARVLVGGSHGGEVKTDSMGRFAFPNLDGGDYMVRVTFPGYTERRFLVQLKRGEGKELAVLLAPYAGVVSKADETALFDLGKRLSVGLARERLSAPQLARYTSVPICDLPDLRSEIGHDRSIPILFVLNGVAADPQADLSRICAWRADEVELVEFGRDVCRDVTSTIPAFAGIWCTGRSRNVPRSIRSGGARVSTQPAGIPYVIIWEKK
jgi:carboxypeptidase family protein